ncbi:MAG: phosphomannomutase/phosphoglucomutase [Gammaproteobacteria bacterium]|nr:phosphomannomutase/phosphoglucomutase [Gammaproteobacteria bacterium]
MDKVRERGNRVKKTRRKQKRASDNGIWYHAILVISIAGFGLLITFALLWWQFVASANEEYRVAQAQVRHASFIGFFDSRIIGLKRQLAALASAPSTVEALIKYDPESIRIAGRELTALMGYARRVDIIAKGTAQVDLNAEVPISYAALNVIIRAETQEFVGPEMSLNQRDLIYAAQPITNEGVVAGVLFVALSRDYFVDPLRSYDDQLGRVSIEQAFSGSAPATVFEWGTGSDVSSVLTAPLKTPGWRLLFQPNGNASGDLATLPQLLAALAVALGTLLGGTSLAFNILSRKLQEDSNTLVDFTSRVMRGRSSKLDSYRLPLFEQIAAGVAVVARAGGKSMGGRAAPPAQRRGESKSQGEPATSEIDLLLKEETKKGGRFLEVNVADDANENFGIEVNEEKGAEDLEFADEIFRAYDIRGITTTNLTEEVVYWIGRAYAAEAIEQKQTRITVGRDGRHSSEALNTALGRGLTEGGVNVVDIGMVPTPLLYFSTFALETGSGIMITGSHNPREYNGLKMMMAGETMGGERIQELKLRIRENRLSKGTGKIQTKNLNDQYIERILENVAMAEPVKVVVDCGNGVAGIIAPRLIEELGCEVVPLYCEVDGDFPNHHPDPSDPANLEDLITVVQAENAELGLAFDGDGDRIGVVTASGEIVWPDKLLMLFAQDIVSRNPGADIIYDVKCSRHLNNLISELGGRPIMWKTGHSHMKAKLKETEALLAGEFSGHICFGERWYGFDDAIYSAARLLEILGSAGMTSDELFAQFPVTCATPEIKIATTEEEKFLIMEKLAECDFGDGTHTTIDGLRVDYQDGWGLVRPSNTSPVLSLRFEADDQQALDRIQDVFQAQLATVDPSLKFR